MFSLQPFFGPVAKQAGDSPQRPDLLRAAIEAHETKLIETSEGRALVLPQLVKSILGREIDRLTFIPKCHEPVAVVDGMLFRGEADDAYTLKNGWLTVGTLPRDSKAISWREVRSLAQLGEVARRYPLAQVPS